MSKPKYSEVVIRVQGTMTWHPIVAIRRVRHALKAAGVDSSELSAFTQEATSGDRRALMATIRRWVTVKD